VNAIVDTHSARLCAALVAGLVAIRKAPFLSAGENYRYTKRGLARNALRLIKTRGNFLVLQSFLVNADPYRFAQVPRSKCTHGCHAQITALFT
jgi:hypothetical protein